MAGSKAGGIVWQDLTVPDAEAVKAFYERVVGWKTSEHRMGDYCDYNVHAEEGDQPIAGICHARGTNENVPPQWLLYVQVEDVIACAEACLASGGKVVDGPRDMGGSRFCIVQDPAGAVLGLIEG